MSPHGLMVVQAIPMFFKSFLNQYIDRETFNKMRHPMPVKNGSRKQNLKFRLLKIQNHPFLAGNILNISKRSIIVPRFNPFNLSSFLADRNPGFRFLKDINKIISIISNGYWAGIIFAFRDFLRFFPFDP